MIVSDYKISRPIMCLYIGNSPLLLFFALKYHFGSAPYSYIIYLGLATFGLFCATFAIYWPIPSRYEIKVFKRPIQISRSFLGVTFTLLSLLAIGKYIPGDNLLIETVLLKITYVIVCISLFIVDWVAQVTSAITPESNDSIEITDKSILVALKKIRHEIIIPAVLATVTTILIYVIFNYENSFIHHVEIFMATFTLLAILTHIIVGTKSSNN